MRAPVLWGAAAVSVVSLLGFVSVSTLMFTGLVAPELKTQLLPVVVTAWVGLAGSAVGFWCGSSVGSAQKTDLLGQKA